MTNHIIRFAWLDDYNASKVLGITSVALQHIDALDTDTNGVQDWVDGILAEGNDTDGDGISDLDELGHQPSALNHLSVDTDGDTLSDYEEIHIYGTDPLHIDSDTNGVNDALLLVEQNASIALSLAQRGYVLETGKIVLQDTAEALQENEMVRKAYLGEE